MARFTIVPDARVPVYDRLYGWRWLLNKVFRIPFKRARVVLQTTDGVYVCHPDTVGVLTTFWKSHGHEYEIDRRAVVRTMPGGEA